MHVLVSAVSYSLSLRSSKMSTSTLAFPTRSGARLIRFLASVMESLSPLLHSIGSSKMAAAERVGGGREKELKCKRTGNFAGFKLSRLADFTLGLTCGCRMFTSRAAHGVHCSKPERKAVFCWLAGKKKLRRGEGRGYEF